MARLTLLNMKMLTGVTAALILSTALSAQTPATAASNPPTSTVAGTAGEIGALERFLDCSDAELLQMEQAIARLRAMTPAQRAALREQIAAFRQLPEPQRRQLRQGWGGMPLELQNGWREMMQSATAAKRAEIQAKLATLTADEKFRYRRELVEEFLKTKPAQK